MWWVLGIWVTLLLLGLAIFHLRANSIRHQRMPVQVHRFVDDLRREIESQRPDVRLMGLVPGRFAAIISIRGQEFPVSLNQAFSRSIAFADSLPAISSSLIQEVEECGFLEPGDHLFADVASKILPQIRSEEWLSENGSRFGDAAIVRRPFSDNLVICYVIDEPSSMIFVTRAHLDMWGRSEEDLYHLSTSNLHRLAGSNLPVPDATTGPVILRTDDGYAASRVLLLDIEETEGLLVAMPERDVLWLGREPMALDCVMRKNQEQNGRAVHPVSPHLYKVCEGRLAQVSRRAARTITGAASL